MLAWGNGIGVLGYWFALFRVHGYGSRWEGVGSVQRGINVRSHRCSPVLGGGGGLSKHRAMDEEHQCIDMST